MGLLEDRLEPPKVFTWKCFRYLRMRFLVSPQVFLVLAKVFQVAAFPPNQAPLGPGHGGRPKDSKEWVGQVHSNTHYDEASPLYVVVQQNTQKSAIKIKVK